MRIVNCFRGVNIPEVSFLRDATEISETIAVSTTGRTTDGLTPYVIKMLCAGYTRSEIVSILSPLVRYNFNYEEGILPLDSVEWAVECFVMLRKNKTSFVIRELKTRNDLT